MKKKDSIIELLKELLTKPDRFGITSRVRKSLKIAGFSNWVSLYMIEIRNVSDYDDFIRISYRYLDEAYKNM
jgi:hypothetical protein